ncbi:MAG: site-2 protease family protein [Gemmatimonadota bacterium]|nr:site-2 protease family protein [Gemmatimonadota bacterium]
MPLFGGFRIGRWFGFPVRIDYSWFLVAALVVWTFSVWEFPRRLPGYDGRTYLVMGASAALLFFLSVLLHELGHAIVGRVRGVTVESITLFVFGGIAQARHDARRPSDEFLLTAAGPLTSVALAGAFHLAGLALDALGAPAAMGEVAGFLALMNLVLAIFNLIPGFPLDGGRIFRSIAWAATGDIVRATRWAAWGGRLFGGFLIAVGVWLFLGGQLLGGVWAGLIGWFLVNAASSSYRHFELRELLRQIPVARVMTDDPDRVPADLTVERAIEDHFLRGRAEAYAVDLDGLLLGFVDVTRAAKVPQALRSETRVADIMRPAYDLPAVRRDDTLADAMALATGGLSSLLVVEERRIVGTLDMDEIGSWVRRMERFGLLGDPDRAVPGRDAGSGTPAPGESDRARAETNGAALEAEGLRSGSASGRGP